MQPPQSPGGAWTESVLFNFGEPGTIEGSPYGDLIPFRHGFVLLTEGNLFYLSPPPDGGTWIGRVIYHFPVDVPANSIVMDDNGVFYGTTKWGGSAPGQLGEVFQLTPPADVSGDWTFTVLHNFGYADGFAGNPNSLTMAADGTIYGTTYGGDCCGGRGYGVVFQLTPPAVPGGEWGYTILKTFQNHPNVPLILRNGNLYGATQTFEGDGGTVFELKPPSAPGGEWTTVFLHSFTAGQGPTSLVVDDRGTLYGTTATGLGPIAGTVYLIAAQ